MVQSTVQATKKIKFQRHRVVMLPFPTSNKISLCSSLIAAGVGRNRQRSEVRLSVSLDGSLEGNGVGADDLADLLAVLVEEESGHGAHALLLGDFGDLVDVDLVEAGVGVVVGEPVGRVFVSDLWSV